MNPPTSACDLTATLARLGNNVTLLKQLGEFLREDLPIYLARLQDAVAIGNPKEVQAAAHRVKGLVVNFNAEPAANAAIRLERMGQISDLTGAAEVLNELEQQTTRLMTELAVEFAKLGP